MNFLYLNTDQMGQGYPALGIRLLESFLNNLIESNIKIDFIGCVNGGVHLTTEGSQVISQLKKLEETGAKIASCGTCLDFFNKRDQLLIGEIGTMSQTIEIMSKADIVFRP